MWFLAEGMWLGLADVVLNSKSVFEWMSATREKETCAAHTCVILGCLVLHISHHGTTVLIYLLYFYSPALRNCSVLLNASFAAYFFLFFTLKMADDKTALVYNIYDVILKKGIWFIRQSEGS